MTDYKAYFDSFCRENNLDITLSYDMPQGYETAYGSFDVTKNTLFINAEMLKDAADYQALFYLYHELRHAVQYHYPERFDRIIQQSCCYSILYNSCCSKLVNGQWKQCVLQGDEQYFTTAYLNSPHEVDANTFAYQMVKQVIGPSQQLDNLYNWWMPKEKFEHSEFVKLYNLIDDNI